MVREILDAQEPATQSECPVQRRQSAVRFGDERPVNRLRHVRAVERRREGRRVLAGTGIEHIAPDLCVHGDTEGAREGSDRLPELPEDQDPVLALRECSVLRIAGAVEPDLPAIGERHLGERKIRIGEDLAERQRCAGHRPGLSEKLLLAWTQRVAALPLEVLEEEAVGGEPRLGAQEVRDGAGWESQDFRRQPGRTRGKVIRELLRFLSRRQGLGHACVLVGAHGGIRTDEPQLLLSLENRVQRQLERRGGRSQRPPFRLQSGEARAERPPRRDEGIRRGEDGAQVPVVVRANDALGSRRRRRARERHPQREPHGGSEHRRLLGQVVLLERTAAESVFAEAVVARQVRFTGKGRKVAHTREGDTGRRRAT